MKVFAHRRHRLARRIWACGTALLLSALWAVPALACTQPPGGHPVYTIAQHVRAADVVLKGTITQVTMENSQNYTATIAVQQYFKGSGSATVTIGNFGTGADCRSVVKAGDTWIFFANGDPNSELSASYLSAFDALATPDADTIAQIIAAVNSRPRAYLPLLAGDGAKIASAAPTSTDNQTLTGLALLFVVVSVLWVRRLWI
jgi:hypothetical protein